MTEDNMIISLNEVQRTFNSDFAPVIMMRVSGSIEWIMSYLLKILGPSLRRIQHCIRANFLQNQAQAKWLGGRERLDELGLIIKLSQAMICAPRDILTSNKICKEL